MARGNFRTGDDVCTYCGIRNDETSIVSRTLNNNKLYLCERCAGRHDEMTKCTINKAVSQETSCA